MTGNVLGDVFTLLVFVALPACAVVALVLMRRR